MKYYSVTEVLSPYFLLDVPKDQRHYIERHLEVAKERGKKVHAACGSYALGIWVAPLPAEWQGYFDSFKTWFDTFVDRVFFVEKRFQCDKFFFTGRIDLGVRLIDRREVVVDLKTPISIGKTWHLQLAGYWYLTKRYAGIECEDAIALRLNSKGKPAKAEGYEIEDLDAAFSVFLGILNGYRYAMG